MKLTAFVNAIVNDKNGGLKVTQMIKKISDTWLSTDLSQIYVHATINVGHFSEIS